MSNDSVYGNFGDDSHSGVQGGRGNHGTNGRSMVQLMQDLTILVNNLVVTV